MSNPLIPALTHESDELTGVLKRLQTSDQQFRDAFPDAMVAAKTADPNLAASQVVETIMTSYGERPALARRSRRIVTDRESGRKVAELDPHFDTLTYGQVWQRACAVAADLARDHQWHCGDDDFVALLGFTSTDYTVIEVALTQLGSITVPLQTGASTAQQVAILEETRPSVVVAGVEYLGEAVAAILAGPHPDRLIVIDYDERIDDHLDAVHEAARRLSDGGCRTVPNTLDAVIARGSTLPSVAPYVPQAGEDPLRGLNYTSGSTGTPKGVMGTEESVKLTWQSPGRLPQIVLAYLPMSHGYGRASLMSALAAGGTVYFLAERDMSTLFDDLALARPTHLNLVPRLATLLHDRYVEELDDAGDSDDAKRSAADTLRNEILGGRVLSALTGSAPLPPELKDFLEAALGIHVTVGYGASEMGSIAIDTVVQRPPVIDYKLIDVPELGYFGTDKPYPRGELIVKTEMFMKGYFKRPDVTAGLVDENGYYHSSDIMAEVAPDRLVYVDRRNNVLKLAQGEFVAIARLESLYSVSPDIDQIYLYGTSERSYLLAVVVPSPELRRRLDADGDVAGVKTTISAALRAEATKNRLNGYEIPRDVIIEPTPFDQSNGLLSALGKLLRPKLREHYGSALEDLYARLADGKTTELKRLRTDGADQPTADTVTAAVCATLGLAATDVTLDSRYGDLGGDSLSALSLSNLLGDIYGFDVPVGVIINPAADLGQLVAFVERQRSGGTAGATFASVHGKGSTKLRPWDLTLDKFIDAETLSTARGLDVAPAVPKTVLLTGATGHLGRRLAVEWLERQARHGGKLICISRGHDAPDARRRIEDALATDPVLLDHFQTLAEKHLDVLAGDLGELRLGLDDDTWARLSESVDLIVHPAAHVNHVLPYQHLFAANVVGTAELIRLALTGKRKPFNYVSSMGVSQLTGHPVTEDEDVRRTVGVVDLGDDGSTPGYGISKWAGEVLARNAAERCDLPVSVFRSGMILPDQHYVGLINVPDIFTRLLYTLIVTGIAPTTFYAADGSKGRPHASYGGVPADALAAGIAAVGSDGRGGFRTFNTDPGYDDGISLDTFVDWIIENGFPIERIDDYATWVERVQTAMRGLPDDQRDHTLIHVMGAYLQPNPTGGDEESGRHFKDATTAAGVELPHVTRQFIDKTLGDMKATGLL
jgi:fatty acid CoA ligase FadD9